MCKIHFCFTIILLILGIVPVFAVDEDFIDPVRSAGASGITAYSSMLSRAPAALARTYVMGSTNAKGIVGESIAAKSFLQTTLQKTGNWYPN